MWLAGSRFGSLPGVWGGLHRLCHGRWHVTTAGGGIGRIEPIGRRGVELAVLKPCLLATNSKLRAEVEDKLAVRWSPEQISGWLRRTYPEVEAMHVSRETIYLSLFIQARGGLRRELARISAPAAPTEGPK